MLFSDLDDVVRSSVFLLIMVALLLTVMPTNALRGKVANRVIPANVPQVQSGLRNMTVGFFQGMREGAVNSYRTDHRQYPFPIIEGIRRGTARTTVGTLSMVIPVLGAIQQEPLLSSSTTSRVSKQRVNGIQIRMTSSKRLPREGHGVEFKSDKLYHSWFKVPF